MIQEQQWYGKPYYSLDAFLKNTYGEKLYKIAVNAGFTCPNRDGSLGRRGCLFCSAGGSGEYAVQTSAYPSISQQITAGISLFHHKRTGQRFIIYFQAYTNTYGPIPHLRSLYTQALQETCVAGISIATRPDCISEETVTMLVNLRKEFPDKFVWIELGLQTIHEHTALFIRRGYPLATYDRCISLLKQSQIPTITHLILGLPGEVEEHVLSTIAHLNQSGTWGVKLQLLHVLRDTDLAILYEQGAYLPLTQDAYIDLVISCLEHLSPDIVIHRLTGDGSRDLLLAPLWSLQKRTVLNRLHHTMKLRAAHQGRLYERPIP